MGIGQGKGKTRAEDAALAAISSPLLDFPITRARGIVFNIVGKSSKTDCDAYVRGGVSLECAREV